MKTENILYTILLTILSFVSPILIILLLIKEFYIPMIMIIIAMILIGIAGILIQEHTDYIRNIACSKIATAVSMICMDNLVGILVMVGLAEAAKNYSLMGYSIGRNGYTFFAFMLILLSIAIIIAVAQLMLMLNLIGYVINSLGVVIGYGMLLYRSGEIRLSKLIEYITEGIIPIADIFMIKGIEEDIRNRIRFNNRRKQDKECTGNNNYNTYSIRNIHYTY